jgi:hypothetical protein
MEFRVNDPRSHLAGYNSEVTVTELLVNSRLHLAQDQKLASCQRTANESQPAVRDNDRELSRRSTFQQVCLNVFFLLKRFSARFLTTSVT